ncbi:toxin glutamine deamidase domain-containing protein [Kitasatospora sp. NBC_01539]|uniref:toxin glutamine deamidase domain-containing protein n=1 Tax=Kitasatospora sp. NBC_01539 TaxID=2903577 RepID=UPI0038600CFE
MPRNLPEELAPVMARLGRHWPEADEDALRRAACLWREFGAEAEQIGRRGVAAAQRVTGENSGPAVEAFADHWRGFSGGGRGHLDDAHAAADAVAGAFDRAAAATDSCKADIVAVLTELAEEIRKADAAEAAAAAQVKDAADDGLTGLVGQVAGTVKGAVAEAGEAVAVGAARTRVTALLAELGRAMKDGLQAALREPAVTALERIAQADGAGRHGELRTLSAARSGGALTGELAGSAVGGAAAVAGVRALSAAVGPDGTVLTDAEGRPVLLGADGAPLGGLDGVTVAVGADGRPLLGEDGRPVVVGADGKEIAGLALGADGKPLTGADGKPLTVTADGAVGDTGLTLAVGKDGHPVLDRHGRPVMLDAEGNPAAGLAVGTDGRILTDGEGRPVVAGVGRDGRPLVDAAVGPDGVRLGVDGLPVAAADLGTDTVPGAVRGAHGGHGRPGGDPLLDAVTGPGVTGPGGTGPVTVQAGPVTVQAAAASGPSLPAAHESAGHRSPVAGHTSAPSAGHSYQAPVYEPVHDLPAAAPRPAGPVSVHTDSVVLAPQPSSGGSYGGTADPGMPVSGVRHGGEPAGPVASGGGAAAGFPLGPVGGAPAGAAPVGAVPSAGVPAAGPVGGAPVTGAPAGGPGAAGAPGAPVGTAVPGAAGQPGAQGGSAGVVGAVVGTPGAASRTPAGGAPGTPAAPGSGAAPLPVRLGEPTADLRRRPEALGTEPHTGPTVVAVLHPGQVAAAYLASRAGRPADGPGAPVPVRSLADGRPYGRPGGLGPVDPAHQAEVERLVPRQPDGTPAPHPDPSGGGWAQALNGGGPREPGRANTGVDLALSGVDTFAGLPVCAAPRLPDGPLGEYGGRDRAERELGTHFLDLGDGEGAFARIADALRRSGPGAQAVLLTLDAFRRSHLWNVVHHGDRLTWVDHQTGAVAAEPLHSAEHGLWAIALDARCRPLDLADTRPAPAARPAAAPEAVPEPPAPEPPAPEPAAAAPEPVPEPARPAEPAPPRSRLTVHRTAAGSTRR